MMIGVEGQRRVTLYVHSLYAIILIAPIMETKVNIFNHAFQELRHSVGRKGMKNVLPKRHGNEPSKKKAEHWCWVLSQFCEVLKLTSANFT